MADINSCSARKLSSITGISTAMAKRIVSFRKREAKIRNFSELWQVNGMTRPLMKTLKASFFIDANRLKLCSPQKNSKTKTKEKKIAKRIKLNKRSPDVGVINKAFGLQDNVPGPSGFQTNNQLSPVLLAPQTVNLISPFSLTASPSGLKMTAVYHLSPQKFAHEHKLQQKSPKKADNGQYIDRIAKNAQHPSILKKRPEISHDGNKRTPLSPTKERSIRDWLNDIPKSFVSYNVPVKIASSPGGLFDDSSKLLAGRNEEQNTSMAKKTGNRDCTNSSKTGSDKQRPGPSLQRKNSSKSKSRSRTPSRSKRSHTRSNSRSHSRTRSEKRSKSRSQSKSRSKSRTPSKALSNSRRSNSSRSRLHIRDRRNSRSKTRSKSKSKSRSGSRSRSRPVSQGRRSVSPSGVTTSGQQTNYQAKQTLKVSSTRKSISFKSEHSDDRRQFERRSDASSRSRNSNRSSSPHQSRKSKGSKSSSSKYSTARSSTSNQKEKDRKKMWKFGTHKRQREKVPLLEEQAIFEKTHNGPITLTDLENSAILDEFDDQPQTDTKLADDKWNAFSAMSEPSVVPSTTLSSYLDHKYTKLSSAESPEGIVRRREYNETSQTRDGTRVARRSLWADNSERYVKIPRGQKKVRERHRRRHRHRERGRRSDNSPNCTIL